MKIASPFVAILFLSATTIACFAQGRSVTGGGGFDTNDIDAKPADAFERPAKTVTTIEYVAVSPMREWKSADDSQAPISGTLLAFASEKGTGKVSIVENEQVRLLVGKKDFTLPLNKLSEEDQKYVAELVESARAAGKLIE